MKFDAYDLATSSDNPMALRAFETAVFELATHRPNTGLALKATLAADPQHIAGHALKGFANLILARSEMSIIAASALEGARAALAANAGGTDDERILVKALEVAVDGSFSRAADILDCGYEDRPATFLPFKISQALRFMLGDAAGMLKASTRAVQNLDAGGRAAGFLLGCHAFALEEHGRYAEALDAGQRAVALQPDDSWGLHAVSHVFEMRGDTSEGIDWLEGSRKAWSRCNNFSFHMAWHLALLHLERGDHDRVLEIYDDEIRPQRTDDFRDMANAVSLLWRLEQSRVHVGERWMDVAEIAYRRRSDTTLIFAALHNLAAMVAVGEREGTAALVAEIDAKALGTGDQARVAAEIGAPMARVLAGIGAPADRQMIDRMVANLPKIGGSNAQRDFFVLALAKAVGAGGDNAAVSRIGHIRQKLKADDRLFKSIERSVGMRLSA
ncbi:tetratricopeptide repeat protein [Sinorhizobium mexicanum]|uniref:Tetratricopeptide repeat protein 38 n=1 Tax=Sinorhizobium mexicanum TaxID=375549 RepID=A0A859QLI6_9HYPH|nr:tetratricopeptide repeat protein [Sinorhizobium mexicanum]MBP1886608.1 tetratricopeptide (TPR) repeat protein [Sinorhizobium mexicanum]QLL64175.1 tetratricopeptide repeat protein [Sinorhizobium mexicanum]